MRFSISYLGLSWLILFPGSLVRAQYGDIGPDTCLVEAAQLLIDEYELPDSLSSLFDTTWAEGDCDSATIYYKPANISLTLEFMTLVRADECHIHMTSQYAPDTIIDICEPAISPRAEAAPRVLLSGSPNPFTESISIRFDPGPLSPDGLSASLSIYRSSGEEILKVPLAVIGPEASGCFSWDGRDDFGVPVQAGNYQAVLRYGGRTSAVKLILHR